jgi:hypothetical protein
MHVDTLLLDNSLWNLLVRFLINLVVLFILIGVVYYKFSRKEEYLFSFFLLGNMIFLISSVLGSRDIQIGMALGLFAIVAILRFRTIQYSVKDITYFFIIIGISVINSQANLHPRVLGAIIINFSIILITYLLELFLQRNYLNKLLISYDKPELLKPAFKEELLKDLTNYTGQNIEKVIIQKISIQRNVAELEVFYKDKKIA